MTTDRIFWIVMGILGIGTLILVLNDGNGRSLGVDNYDFARIVQLGALAVVFAAAILARGAPAGHTLRQAALWLVIFLAIMVAYQFADRYGWLPGRPRPTPVDSGAGISASLMDGVDRIFHL